MPLFALLSIVIAVKGQISPITHKSAPPPLLLLLIAATAIAMAGDHNK